MTRCKEEPMTAVAHPISISKRSRAGSPTGGCAEDATSPTPPSMADSPTRAAAYVRESTEEQGQGFSPDAQRQAIATFAAENALGLIGEYCHFHSGWRKSEARPEFQRLMADAAAGKFDVVLVFHTSRFARNQIEARRYKQLLRERLGIRVVSVTQPMGEDHTDPCAFLAESIHEMFDEYYSVSLSFWTRSGLREKARQGHLVGSLPWGYVRDPTTKLATPDPERAPLVLAMFERYATGQESDRTLAAWLNAKGARSARGRLFGKDTVREMLSNLAYAGYVSGMRDKSRSIRGLHEAIVSEEMFDRVQEVRSWSARGVKAGGARAPGPPPGRNAMRPSQCPPRRHHGTCEQRTVPAIPLEEQLIDWLHDFQPDQALRRLVLDTIQAQAGTRPGEDTERRRQLTNQLERLRDLYVMGALSKPEYVIRRQALEEELQRTKPPTNPDLDRAAAILEDFARFWDAEPEPAERRKLILSLFEQVWQKDGKIVAVKPNHAFASYFTAASEGRPTHPKASGSSEATKAGATGVQPSSGTPSRSARG